LVVVLGIAVFSNVLVEGCYGNFDPYITFVIFSSGFVTKLAADAIEGTTVSPKTSCED